MSLTYFICVLFVLTSHAVYSQSEVGDKCTIMRSNERGICTIISQCTEVTRRLREQRIRPTTCGFRGSQTIVCCPNNEPPPTGNRNRESSQPTRTTNSGSNFNNFESNGKRISERKCEEYSSRVVTVVEALPLLPDSEPLTFKVASCEYSNVPLIVGGEEVNVGEFPHMAAIGWPLNGKNNEYAWNCGGSLISENFVLTAGHCTSDERNNLLNSSLPTMVRLGEHNLKSDYDGAEPQNIGISAIIKHPEYKPPMKYHDIALLKLKSPASFNKFVRPACLWQKPTFPQNTAIATGWGRINYAEDPSDVLRRVSIKLIDQNVCKTLYSARNRKLIRGIIDEQLCAGELEGGKDTCQGDSGGPLQVSESSNLCIFYIVGVTSFGSGCGGKNTPGVYTRVSSYVDWIERTVWPGQF